VKGRKTGRSRTLALVVAKYQGQDYLVSMLGDCEWVKNARAYGEAYLSGRRRKVALEEVSIEHRSPIIKEYLRLAPGGRPHIGLGVSATIADCERVAPNHPVFRISIRTSRRSLGVRPVKVSGDDAATAATACLQRSCLTISWSLLTPDAASLRGSREWAISRLRSLAMSPRRSSP
jgi:hypothetical protein